MKSFILLLFLICCQSITAQTNNYKITYKNFEGNLKRDAVLYLKENQPTVMRTIIASTVPLEIIKDSTYIDSNGATTTVFGSGNKDYSIFPDEYIKVDHLNNKIEMIKVVLEKKFLITDELNYNWNITNETKQIQNYTCYKATTSFRGNNFEAWFTPDIPVNAGPWKWYGLPGLIVEATDTDKSEVYLLEKIEKLTDEIPFPSTKSEKLTLRKYFKNAEEAMDAFLSELNERNVTVTSNVIGRFGLERVYEWEEIPEK